MSLNCTIQWFVFKNIVCDVGLLNVRCYGRLLMYFLCRSVVSHQRFLQSIHVVRGRQLYGWFGEWRVDILDPQSHYNETATGGCGKAVMFRKYKEELLKIPVYKTDSWVLIYEGEWIGSCFEDCVELIEGGIEFLSHWTLLLLLIWLWPNQKDKRRKGMLLQLCVESDRWPAPLDCQVSNGKII